jgi:nitric oxide reductase subunit C
MLAGLVACFAVQTSLVYSDDVDLVLSDEAVQGRRLFHENACQVCHQLWGQGGFLGPDLTNAASRVDETRLASLLTVGSGQMPAFGFSSEDIAAVRAYLHELDAADVGRGQLRLGDPDSGTSPQAAFEAAVAVALPPPEAAAGFDTFRAGICATCHFPFQVSPMLAPDLSLVVERSADAELDAVLTMGRPEKGMPPPFPALDQNDRAGLVAYFRWLNENRASLIAESGRLQAGRSVDWARLPWWEYR